MPWMLDIREWPGTAADHVGHLLDMTEVVFLDLRHPFRSYSASEVGRLMTAPAARSVPAP